MDLLNLLNDTIKKYGIDFLSKKIEVNKGAIKRWVSQKHIPEYYKIDLFKLNDLEIDYTQLTDREKDKFYTDEVTSKYCYNVLKDILKKYNENIKDFTFVEPSVGNGSFYNLIEYQKIGIDIQPEIENTITSDYLEWNPSDYTKKYIVLGNPPFGLRGNMALRFMNHSDYAEYIAFILPKTFESNGKGSCKKRVKNFNLIHSEDINPDFYYTDGKHVKVNVIFQIWSKFNKIDEQIKESKSFIKLYSVSDGPNPSQIRNKKMIGKCDFYLPITCFGEDNMKIYENFNNLPKKMGIGVVLKKDKINLKNTLYNTKWSEVAFQSTNGAYNLRFDLIHTHLAENGFIDKTQNTILKFT
jgi:hypothetical protein